MIKGLVTIDPSDPSTISVRFRSIITASTVWGELVISLLLVCWSVILALPDSMMHRIPSMSALPLIMPEQTWAGVFAGIGGTSLFCAIGGWYGPRRICLFVSTGLWSFLAWQAYLATAWQTIGLITYGVIALCCQAMYWQIRFRTSGR